MATRMQQRRGTETQWTTANPILNIGEIGFESDTNKFKIGDGVNHWDDLPYFLDADSIGTSLDGYIPDTLLGAANGVAQLNSSGKLVSDQIPNVDEITQDAINTALVAGTGLDKTYDDNANTITIDIDSTVATKTYVDDAVAAVDLSSKQDVVSGVSSTEIGYLDGVTSAIQTQLNAKAASADIAELAQDAVGNAIGTGLTYTDSTGAISADITYLANALVVEGSGLSGTGGNIGVRLGNYVTVENYDLTVDGYSLFNAWTKPNGGIVLDGPSGIMVDTDVIAPLDSPALTGTPTAPTATAGTNSTQVATTAYADAAVAALVDSAPGALNTLNELAAAINDDASYAATITTALGLKAPLEDPTFTGTVDFTGATVTGIPVTEAAAPTTLGTVYGATGNPSSTYNSAIALGFGSQAEAANAIAIGHDVQSNYSNSTVIGYMASSNAANQIVLGNGDIKSFKIPGLGIDINKNIELMQIMGAY
jgi:hypothetical protein